MVELDMGHTAFDDFLAERLERDLEHNTLHRRLWTAWTAWCVIHSLPQDTTQQFTARMKLRRYGAHTFHEPGGSVACYLGYRLREAGDE